MTQKIKKFSIIALALISLNAKAQMKLGVTGGVQTNFVSTDFNSGLKNLTTPTFGIVAQANLGGGLMFRPSVNYFKDGYNAFTSTTRVL